MTLSTAAKAKPAFFYGNYFNRHADDGGQMSTNPSGNTLRHRLYDMDPLAQWTSAGSDDTTDEVLTSQLWIPGMQSAQDIDLVAFLNHNLKEFTLDLYDGVTPSEAFTDDDNAQTDTVTAITSTTADSLILTMSKTQSANAEKLLGTLVLGKLNFQTAERFLSYDPLPVRDGAKSVEMYDHSLKTAYNFRSDGKADFYAADCSWYVDTAAELARFWALLRRREDFLFMPFPGDHPEFIKLCRIRPGTFQVKPFRRSTPDINVVSMTIEETGGA